MSLHLDFCSHKAALYACKHWHYSKCIPAGKLVKIGVWEDDEFIGCVIFGRGANNHIGSMYGLMQIEVCELVRIALTVHQAPVSRLMSLAVHFLKKQSPGLRLIVSYADPAQCHRGGIYQAANWIYSGKSKAQREIIINGREIHKRSVNAKYGTASPEKIMKMTGLKAVKFGPKRWKYTYLLPLDRDMRKQILPLSKPYPKKEASVV